MIDPAKLLSVAACAALCDLIDQADRLVRVSVANVRDHDPARLVAEHVALIEAMQRRAEIVEHGREVTGQCGTTAD